MTNDICQASAVKNACLTGAQNVQQSTEGLPNIFVRHARNNFRDHWKNSVEAQRWMDFKRIASMLPFAKMHQ